MSDVMLLGVLRMPMPDNPADMGGLEWAQVKDRMRQAADEIEKERAAVDGHIRLIEVLEDEVARLRAELAAEREKVVKLREALAPFAKAAANFETMPVKDPEGWYAYSGESSATGVKGAITVGDLRRASAVLEETGGWDG